MRGAMKKALSLFHGRLSLSLIPPTKPNVVKATSWPDWYPDRKHYLRVPYQTGKHDPRDQSGIIPNPERSVSYYRLYQCAKNIRAERSILIWTVKRVALLEVPIPHANVIRKLSTHWWLVIWLWKLWHWKQPQEQRRWHSGATSKPWI